MIHLCDAKLHKTGPFGPPTKEQGGDLQVRRKGSLVLQNQFISFRTSCELL